MKYLETSGEVSEITPIYINTLGTSVLRKIHLNTYMYIYIHQRLEEKKKAGAGVTSEERHSFVGCESVAVHAENLLLTNYAVILMRVKD